MGILYCTLSEFSYIFQSLFLVSWWFWTLRNQINNILCYKLLLHFVLGIFRWSPRMWLCCLQKRERAMQAHIMVGHFCVTISLGIEPRDYKMITLNYPVIFFINLILLLLLGFFLVEYPITLLETVVSHCWKQ